MYKAFWRGDNGQLSLVNQIWEITSKTYDTSWW
jgi:hypothetical protein